MIKLCVHLLVISVFFIVTEVTRVAMVKAATKIITETNFKQYTLYYEIFYGSCSGNWVAENAKVKEHILV
jgi:hypothetical protein